jgi:hypothetical protein
MEKLNFDKDSLIKFGITMGVAFLVVTFIIFIKHRHSIVPTAVIAALFLAVAFLIPFILKPVYIAWMRLAYVLAWLNTRLILAILFYLVFTPMGLFLRLLRKDLLERKIEKGQQSYWKKKEAVIFNPRGYERQF